MEKFNTKELQDSLNSFEPGQSFTIEHLVRKVGEKKGEKWAGVFEVEAQVEIERYLLEMGLIKECGETKLYNILVK